MPSTILFVGAGRHQRRAIERVRELGSRVVAVDRNADAPGLALADEAEVVDFSDAAAVTEVGRRHDVEGVMTVASDRAVPVVAASSANSLARFSALSGGMSLVVSVVFMMVVLRFQCTRIAEMPKVRFGVVTEFARTLIA